MYYKTVFKRDFTFCAIPFVNLFDNDCFTNAIPVISDTRYLFENRWYIHYTKFTKDYSHANSIKRTFGSHTGFHDINSE